MRIHRLLIVAVCVGLIASFGLACCCPMAFPISGYPSPSDTSSTKIGVPKLEITSPTEGAITESSQIDVSGFTDSDATLSVNGKEIEVYSDGSFKGFVELQQGENTLVFSAVRSGGDPIIREINVTSNCYT